MQEFVEKRTRSATNSWWPGRSIYCLCTACKSAVNWQDKEGTFWRNISLQWHGHMKYRSCNQCDSGDALSPGTSGMQWLTMTMDIKSITCHTNGSSCVSIVTDEDALTSHLSPVYCLASASAFTLAEWCICLRVCMQVFTNEITLVNDCQ